MTFLGIYKGVCYYTDRGTIKCQFGWVPKEFQSIRAFKLAVTRWINT